MKQPRPKPRDIPAITCPTGKRPSPQVCDVLKLCLSCAQRIQEVEQGTVRVVPTHVREPLSGPQVDPWL